MPHITVEFSPALWLRDLILATAATRVPVHVSVEAIEMDRATHSKKEVTP